MKTNYIVLMILMVLISCAQPKPRKPIGYNTGRDQSASIAFNRKLYAQEEQLIRQYMEQDTVNKFKSSQFGYWYAYIKQMENLVEVPKAGDLVRFKYHVSNLRDDELYSEEELGVQNYRVEQEDMIQGIKEGIKQMHVGEQIKFLFPSHMAYAYYGDENKIGSNTPIIVELELLSIEKN